jgi:hypothetical protein
VEKRRNNIEEEGYSQTSFLLTGPGHPVRADIRSWVMLGGDPTTILSNGLPLWAQAMKWGDIDAVEEALSLGSDINARDSEGRGWLWWGTQSGLPPTLLLSHMKLLNDNWWAPDIYDITPFHHPNLHPSLAHAMACRWWAEGLSWRLMIEYGDPIEKAKQNSRWDLVSMWNGHSNSLPWFTKP